VALSQLSGAIVVWLTVAVLPAATPATADLRWGMAAGLAGGVGVALLYRALAVGTMGVVAPVTAVCAVALPVLVSVLAGDRPSPTVTLGIALALGAIVLVAQEAPSSGGGDGGASARRGVALALVSGVAIGVFFLALARAGPNAGLWPLVASRSVSALGFTVGALLLRRPLGLPAGQSLLCASCGVLDVTANVLYLLASRGESLPIVVTLASMYPASTVLLARVVLGERLNRLQNAGLVGALVAVGLIVWG
jgi:drug/metabolite transporter (DMT)-like permease